MSKKPNAVETTVTTDDGKTYERSFTSIRDAMRVNIRKMQKDHEAMQKHFKVLETKAKYRTSEALQLELDTCAEALAESESAIEEAQMDLADFERQKQKEILATEREKLKEEARDITFNIPHYDALSLCEGLNALAEHYQFKFVSGKSYLHWLTNQVESRFNDDGEDKGYTAEDTPIPEVTISDQEKLDRLRAQRRQLQIYRLAVEIAFNKALRDLPDDAAYRPKLMRRTDAEVLDSLEVSKAKKFEERIAQAKALRESSRKLSDFEDSIYSPGKVA